MAMSASEQSSGPGGRAQRSSVGASNDEERLVRVAVLAREPVAVEPVRAALNDRRIQLRVAGDLPESTALLESWQPDVVIVDVDMDAGQTLDGQANRLPVIALTRARDALSAFERGAADVLVAPFAPEEPLARVLALGRGARRTRTFAAVVRFGELAIDLLRGRSSLGVTEFRVTPTERACCTCWSRMPAVS